MALVPVRRLTETVWDALEGQKWFPYSYDKVKTLVLLVELLSVHRSAGGAKVPGGGQPKAEQRYIEEFANRGMSVKFATLA